MASARGDDFGTKLQSAGQCLFVSGRKPGSAEGAPAGVPPELYVGINPFEREGVRLGQLDLVVLKDPTQPTAAAIIDQVAQGTMLRIVLPWMIGRAFEKLGEPAFVAKLAAKSKN